jgi:hypothetical protein
LGVCFDVYWEDWDEASIEAEKLLADIRTFAFKEVGLQESMFCC